MNLQERCQDQIDQTEKAFFFKKGVLQVIKMKIGTVGSFYPGKMGKSVENTLKFTVRGNK